MYAPNSLNVCIDRLGPRFVEISTLDLIAGVSNLEYVSWVPDNDFINDAAHDCVVCSDIVAVYIRRRMQVLLINWRTSSRIVVSVDNIENSQIAVIPDYLIVTLATMWHGEHRLAFSPFASIAFWEPNDSVVPPSTHIPLAGLPFFLGVNEPISLAGQPPSRSPRIRRLMWVHKSPLQRGRFKIWLHTWVHGAPALCSFECVKHSTGVVCS
jgi:hypothetical protein